ncbi:helix-turn-helix transcriptional regulator [Paenibacillus cremeus]|uniref:PadR family transcriptional regulator n=1 Tax=Paenibacillus cremeus TaxID=2163881 RepID=A0A559JRA6_9BACL|nr:helix-turn-helix transcriptional regulator [Paenibacillus cremeus]TVY02406.1 hypothetical protein FPZ49_31605 [Paenibacillus cremeus]
MPIKKNAMNAPDRLGISKVELLYLIVFHKLTTRSMGSKDLIDAIKLELATFDQRRHLSHIYDVLQSMESFGWIADQDGRGRDKTFGLTTTGREKMHWFESTYLETVNKIYTMTKHFVLYIQGDPTYPAPELTNEEIKLLNRLINVKHTVRYLFMDMLKEHRETGVTGKQFLETMEKTHRWRVDDSYLYQLLRAIEGPEGWVVGKWDDERKRNSFYYRLTSAGERIMAIEGENTSSLMKDVMKYTGNILRLFGKRSVKEQGTSGSQTAISEYEKDGVNLGSIHSFSDTPIILPN